MTSPEGGAQQKTRQSGRIKTRQSVVVMSRQVLASRSAMFVFDYNRLESVLLIVSVIILTSGMIFQVL
jgi:hypothetical protein